MNGIHTPPVTPKPEPPSPEAMRARTPAENRRHCFNHFWAVVVILFALFSVWAAACNDALAGWITRDNLGKAIVALWAVGPPVFFWVDWVKFCAYMEPGSKERDVAKHTHDLSRNIWLGLSPYSPSRFLR
jgi:hypothetical protein